jgi:hypothetical protein
MEVFVNLNDKNKEKMGKNSSLLIIFLFAGFTFRL